MRGAAPWKILLVYAGASLFLWLVFKAVDVCITSSNPIRGTGGVALSNFRNTLSVFLALGFILLMQALALDTISEYKSPFTDWFRGSLFFLLFSLWICVKDSVVSATGRTVLLLLLYSFVLQWKVKGDVINNFSESDPSKCNAADYATLQTELSVVCTIVTDSTNYDLGCPTPFVKLGDWSIIPYSQKTWRFIFWTACAVLSLHTIFVKIRDNIWHCFYTNSLVAAFYHQRFRCGKCFRIQDGQKQAGNAKTRYVGGMVINQWQDHPDRSYGPLTCENLDPKEDYPLERRDINHMQWGVFEAGQTLDGEDKKNVIAEKFLIDDAMGASGAAGDFIA
jgi:hypothetical protein